VPLPSKWPSRLILKKLRSMQGMDGTLSAMSSVILSSPPASLLTVAMPLALWLISVVVSQTGSEPSGSIANLAPRSKSVILSMFGSVPPKDS
jgi:hypothetical protein